MPIGVLHEMIQGGWGWGKGAGASALILGPEPTGAFRPTQAALVILLASVAQRAKRRRCR